jgi:hypothetical protein
LVTASNTSDGSTPRATSVATRRKAACSPASRLLAGKPAILGVERGTVGRLVEFPGNGRFVGD